MEEKKIVQNTDISKDCDQTENERSVSFTRRQILHMGWSAPVVIGLTLGLKNTAFAQSVHQDHADHSDHIDGHSDYSDHVDAKKK